MCNGYFLLKPKLIAHSLEGYYEPVNSFHAYAKEGALGGVDCEVYGADGFCKPCSFVALQKST